MGLGQHRHGWKDRGGTDVMELENGAETQQANSFKLERRGTLQMFSLLNVTSVLNDLSLDLTTSSSELSYLC